MTIDALQNKPLHYSSNEIVLSNESSITKVQILRVGKNYNPKYGTVVVTLAMIEKIRDNLNNGAHEVDIPVKFSHDDDRAAGWFKQCAVEEINGETWLTADVEWNELGIDTIRKKIKKYISGEITRKMPDAKTGKDLGELMFGAALTSQPVIVGQQAIIASHNNKQEEEKERTMDNVDVKKTSEYIELAATKKAQDSTIEKLTLSIENKDKELLESKTKIEELNAKLKVAEEKERDAALLSLKEDSMKPNDEGKCKCTAEMFEKSVKPIALSQGLDTAKEFLNAMPATIDLGKEKGVTSDSKEKGDTKELSAEQANEELSKIALNHVNNLSLSMSDAIQKAMSDNVKLVEIMNSEVK